MTSLSLFTFTHWRRIGNPLQYSCLEKPRDGGAWWAALYGVEQSQTRLKRVSSSSSSSRWLRGKESACNTGDEGDAVLILGLEPLEEEMTTQLQYSCLGNPMDRGAWRATVHGVPRVRHNLMTKPPLLPLLMLLLLLLLLFLLLTTTAIEFERKSSEP